MQGVHNLLEFIAFIFSAHCKAGQILDSYATMTSYHPMWRNFDMLYLRVISKPVLLHQKIYFFLCILLKYFL